MVGMCWRIKRFKKGSLCPGEALNISTGVNAGAVHPAVGRDPLRMSACTVPLSLAADCLTALGSDPLLGVLKFDVRLGEVEHAAVGIIERGSEIGRKLALEYDAQAIARSGCRRHK
jgi:hypothetical protein